MTMIMMKHGRIVLRWFSQHSRHNWYHWWNHPQVVSHHHHCHQHHHHHCHQLHHHHSHHNHQKNTEHQYIIDALGNLHTLIITQDSLRSDAIFWDLTRSADLKWPNLTLTFDIQIWDFTFYCLNFMFTFYTDILHL